jgi:hypothetical protein
MSAGVYGYCVVPRAHAIPAALTGLRGAAIRAHAVDDLAVVVSEMDRPEATAEHIEQHNAVIEGVVTESVTPVPLRFGQWGPDAAVFDKVVREKAAWYHERLKAFAGALEFGLRAVRPDRPPPARDVRLAQAATGRAYMDALRERVVAERGHSGEAERLRQGISEVLGAFVREERVEEARTPHGIITVSHLVPRQHFDEYREHAQRLRTRYPDMRFLVSGPWMPYSFAS